MWFFLFEVHWGQQSETANLIWGKTNTQELSNLPHKVKRLYV